MEDRSIRGSLTVRTATNAWDYRHLIQLRWPGRLPERDRALLESCWRDFAAIASENAAGMYKRHHE